MEDLCCCLSWAVVLTVGMTAQLVGVDPYCDYEGCSVLNYSEISCQNKVSHVGWTNLFVLLIFWDLFQSYQGDMVKYYM